MVRAGDRDVLIPAEGLIVGRAAECDLTLDTNGASRRHARIYVDERGAWVEDLGSTNGTLLNGERPTPGRRALSSGDRIVIGSQELLALAGKRTTFQPEYDPGDVPARLPPIALSDVPLTIGRDAANVLTLDDPNVSRFHAEVRRESRRVIFTRSRLAQRHPSERRAGESSRTGTRGQGGDRRLPVDLHRLERHVHRRSAGASSRCPRGGGVRR